MWDLWTHNRKQLNTLRYAFNEVNRRTSPLVISAFFFIWNIPSFPYPHFFCCSVTSHTLFICVCI